MVREFLTDMHGYGDTWATEQWKSLMEELFNFNDPDDSEQQEVWDKEASYCDVCIIKFFETQFPKWWFARRNSRTW
jgi:hypothetical protein